jgi:hypothetical protein
MSGDQETLRRFLDLRGVVERAGFRIDLGVIGSDAGVVGEAGVGEAGVCEAGVGEAGVGKAGVGKADVGKADVGKAGVGGL